MRVSASRPSWCGGAYSCMLRFAVGVPRKQLSTHALIEGSKQGVRCIGQCQIARPTHLASFFFGQEPLAQHWHRVGQQRQDRLGSGLRAGRAKGDGDRLVQLRMTSTSDIVCP